MFNRNSHKNTLRFQKVLFMNTIHFLLLGKHLVCSLSPYASFKPERSAFSTFFVRQVGEATCRLVGSGFIVIINAWKLIQRPHAAFQPVPE